MSVDAYHIAWKTVQLQLEGTPRSHPVVVWHMSLNLPSTLAEALVLGRSDNRGCTPGLVLLLGKVVSRGPETGLARLTLIMRISRNGIVSSKERVRWPSASAITTGTFARASAIAVAGSFVASRTIMDCLSFSLPVRIRC